ncbi:hypothetical protein RGU12_02120 [Fredinandcohnia sp. QZ13]|uniref:hypothetical protein n=1 Tax=Fredinandcohnia sp. QZ13 TaxID=3073144 RepID=UPI0028534030|nr:hypothetical protein [Fredinandcohnia sp. QZ13]MDR4886339.1 hypothetical protein [Fredinandcohnia sp. QZ13]
MTAKTLTSFASGLLLAAVVCAVVYFFGPEQATTTKAGEKPTVEELKSLLTDEGYVVHTEEEWNQAIAEAKNPVEKPQEQPKEEVKEEPAEEPKEEPSEPEVKKTVINVTEGMTSYEVGKALISAQIISGNAWDFANLVEKKGVAKYLKLGTYEINSNMTTDEIISTIFNKK